MPLLAIIDEKAFEGLADETVLGKDSFKQNDEDKQFYLNLPAGEAGKIAFNLQAEKNKLADNNKKLLDEKVQALAKASAFEEIGKTPEEIQEYLKTNQPEAVQELVEKHKAEIKLKDDSFQQQLAKEREARQGLQSSMQKTLSQARLATLVNKFGMESNAVDTLEKHIRFEPKEEGSTEYVEKVYSRDGEQLLVAGQPINGEQLVQGWIEEEKHGNLFAAKGGGGTGGRNDQKQFSSGTKTMKRSEFDGISPPDRMAFIKDGGKLID